MSKKGTVYLVGAGPGDPGLCTVRCLELIRSADVIVYDYLVDERVLREAKASAELVYVGKQAGHHTMRQEDINRLLIELSSKHSCVVRLKGGDPFVFGRGGEEALELQAAGVPFEVVPGVTSGIAAPAYAGVPLTHRGVATSALFVTGHEDPSKVKEDLDWTALAPTGSTLAFYMGVRNVGPIAKKLMETGRSGETPAALIRWGTTPLQHTLVARLDEIADRAAEQGFAPPAIFLVGKVISLRDRLRWFDNRPLFGKRIVVTRSRAQASELTQLLESRGAAVIEAPTIDIRPPESYDELDSAIGRIQEYSWVVLTSQNAVQALFERLQALGFDSRLLAGVKCAVVGDATASALLTYGIRADLTPARQTADGLLTAFEAQKIMLSGERFLFPCSNLSGRTLTDGLQVLGAEVDRTIAYITAVSELPEQLTSDLKPDLVTFTSSSTVTNFAAGMRSAGRENELASIAGASIGPVTTNTASDEGISIVVEADEPSIASLVHSVEEYFMNTRGSI